LSPNAIEDEYQRRFALGRLAYYQQCNGEGVDGRLVARGLERLHEQGRKRDLRWSVSRRNTVVLASAHRPKLVLSGVPDEVFLLPMADCMPHGKVQRHSTFSVQPDGQD
jgi:predicted N-acetyltransferase YhbS